MSQSIWGGTDRGPATATMKVPVDTGSSSTPGNLTVAELGTFATGSAIAATGTVTDGKVLIGSTSTGGLALATLTAGTNVTITNAGGSVTIAASGGSGSPAGTNGAIQYNSSGSFGGAVITGLVKGNGTSAPAAATAGTDYQAPITLTTTGTSGAATFTSNTLNIPQYTGGGGSGTVNSGTANQASYYASTGTAVSGLADVIFDGSAHKYYFGPNGLTNSALVVDGSATSMVNGVTISGSVTGTGPNITSSGMDTNLDLFIGPRGNGAMHYSNTGSGSHIWTVNNSTRMTLANTALTLPTAVGSTFNGSFTATAASAFSPIAVSSGVASHLTYTGGADTGLTASTEAPSIYWNMGQTRTHATGAITLQRDMRVNPTTHAFVAASTITDSATVSVDGPPLGGANATITNAHGIYIPSTTALTNTTNGYGLTAIAPTGATNNFAAQFLGAVYISGAISGFLTTLNNQTGTTYTLLSTDSGCTVTLNNASSITLTLPNSFPAGYTCEIIQLGAGQVTFTPASGATLQNRSSNTKVAGQYGAARLTVVTNAGGTSAVYNLAGDTA